MITMVDDDTIYADLMDRLSDEEIAVVRKLMLVWADLMEVAPGNEKEHQGRFCRLHQHDRNHGTAYRRAAATTHSSRRTRWEYYERTHTA
jgi:hypothetical protein